MDLDKNLIESGKRKSQNSWRGVTASFVAHGALFGLVAVLSLNATEKVDAEDKAVPVYMQEAAAPPPPPPPPPPAGAPATPQRATPKIEQPIPVEVPKFVAPIEIPKTVPTVEAPASTETEQVSEPLAPGTPIGGVAGGVEGGTVGGQLGGQLGGVIGGVQGGVVGGTPGGVLGGTPGGTGTAPAPAPVVAPPAPPAPSGPVRVGGDVRAPVVVNRVEPKYTDPARRARITGTVIVEAIIDKQGNVDRVRVVKGLPMGLSEAAADAVRRWKFRPGTQQGRPVDVIFNLTVVFTLNDGGGVRGEARMPRPGARPTPAPKPADPPAAAEEPAPAPEPEPAPSEPAPAPESTDPSTP